MTEQDDITDMKKCRTGRRWMIGLLLGLGIILAGCGSRRSTADDTVTSEEIQMDRIVVGFPSWERNPTGAVPTRSP